MLCDTLCWKSNENKPLKYLLGHPLGENAFDVRLIYAGTRRHSLYSFIK